MKRAALLVLFLIPATAKASTGTALPHGAHLLATVGIPGRSRAAAVAYRLKMTYLGVTVGGRLIWHRPLRGTLKRLEAPGPDGLVAATSTLGDTSHIYAYSDTGGTVTSGIMGVESGTLQGEGVGLATAKFTVRRPDTSHVGSVRYRLVTTYELCNTLFCNVGTVTRPDYSRSQYPVPNATVHLANGNVVLLRLEIAETIAEQNQGLMNIKVLDPDTGMIFVWSSQVLCSFWMHDTFIPLTIAFLGPDGTIQQLIDMAPLDDSILYTPAQPYQFAIEANQGYFVQHGIDVGDRVEFDIGSKPLTDSPKTCYG